MTQTIIMIVASVSVLNRLPITSFCCPCFNTFIRLTHHSYIRRNHNPIKPFNFLSMTKSISSNVNNRKPTQGLSYFFVMLGCVRQLCNYLNKFINYFFSFSINYYNSYNIFKLYFILYK